VEKDAVQNAGIDIRDTLTTDSLVKTNEVFFAATGISGGTFLRGVEYTGNGATTHSMLTRAKTGSLRYMEAHHNWSRLMKISAVDYD
jgi:fructose-1,6-bisphosphatase II